MARTQSWTRTSTRIEFILNHFRTALNRLTEYDSHTISKVLDGIKSEEIEYLEFVGYIQTNNKRNVVVRLRLSVDWDEHHHLKIEQPNVYYSNKLEEANSPEIYGLIILTQKTMIDNNLKQAVLYGYTNRILYNAQLLSDVRKKYGTSPTGDLYDYSKLKYKEHCSSPETPELSGECELS